MSKKIFILIVGALLVIGALFALRELTTDSKETFEVTQIIDGDTIKISTGEKVRLIGINTPEKGQPYYEEATNKLRELIGNNSVTLKKDVENKDQYGRLLRYVYVGDTFVNEEMVRRGYAIAYHFPPNVKYSEELESAEEEAKNKQIGIWTPSTFTLEVSYLDADDECVVFENNGDSSIDITDWTVQDEANNFYIFPTFSLLNGSSVTLHTGSGSDSSTELYWGSTNPIWNNDGDTLYLRDAEGLLVTYYSY